MDGKAEILIYSDESYILKMWIIIFDIAVSVVVWYALIMRGIRKNIKYIYRLCEEIENISLGNLSNNITVEGNNELGVLAAHLDQMRIALITQQEIERGLIKQRNEMITNLSHDLRTPLTKMLLYLEIIKNEKYESKEELENYLNLISEKGMQLKKMSECILQYSINQQVVNDSCSRDLEFKQAFFETLSETVFYLKEEGYAVDTKIEWKNCLIKVNESYVNRILDNIVSNIKRYGDEKYPISIKTIETREFIGFGFMNYIKKAEDLDSKKIGLDNLKYMIKSMNGVCNIEEKSNQYGITVLFRKCKE